MSLTSYEEIVEQGTESGRRAERMAIAHSLDLMETAQETGAQTQEALVAVHFTRRLWELLLRDLASPDNGLPQRLRADLISIGIGVLRELEELRQNRKTDFEHVIFLSRTILGGLQ